MALIPGVACWWRCGRRWWAGALWWSPSSGWPTRSRRAECAMCLPTCRPRCGGCMPARRVPPSMSGERGLREEERAALDEVVSAVRRPHLPTEAGLLVVPYNRVLEPAHRLGRQLHGAGDAGLTEAVAVEV